MGCDVTCPDTRAPSHLNRVVAGSGALASFAEANKSTKYAELSWTHFFVPIASESRGCIGETGCPF